MVDANTVAALERLARGEEGAVDELLPRVYDELRGVAIGLYHPRAGSPTLPPTAVVHEAYVRLVGSEKLAWDGRTHFVALAAKVMRQVLIDHHRQGKAAKRGGDWERVTLSGLPPGIAANDQLDFMALEEALVELGELDLRQAQVVELRFFGGLTMPEIADHLGVSLATAEGDWRHARAWLTGRLS
ncbi:MAG: ECF-type sigma factor [Planctomycetota bacterium]